jgi:hypothetical protein
MREHHAYLALGCVLLGMLSLRQPTLCAPFLRRQILTRIDLARRSAALGARGSTLCERQFRAAIYDTFRVMILLAMR